MSNTRHSIPVSPPPDNLCFIEAGILVDPLGRQPELLGTARTFILSSRQAVEEIKDTLKLGI